MFIFKSQWSRNEYIRCCEIRATLVQTSRYPSTNSRVLLSCPRIGRSVVEEAEKGKKEEKADRTGATLSLTYRSNSLIKLPMNYSRVHAWKKKYDLADLWKICQSRVHGVREADSKLLQRIGGSGVTNNFPAVPYRLFETRWSFSPEYRSSFISLERPKFVTHGCCPPWMIVVWCGEENG